MAPGAYRAKRILAGVLLIGLLIAHTLVKIHLGIPSEMLAMCHVTTLLVAVGLIFELPSLILVGGLLHLCIGLLGYVVDALAAGTTTVTSALLHVLTPLFAFLEMRRLGDIPAWVPWATFALYVAVLPVSWFFTDPALNVNLVHAAWPPIRYLFPNPILAIGGNLVSMLIFLLGGRQILLRWVRPRA